MTDREVWLEIARRLEYAPRSYGPMSRIKRSQGLCLYASDLEVESKLFRNQYRRLRSRVREIFGDGDNDAHVWFPYDREHRILAAGLLAAMATRNLK